MTTDTDPVEELVGLRDLDRERLLSRVGIDESTVAEGYSYEGLEDLAMVHDPDRHPGYFYFDDGDTVMIYVSDPDYLDSVTAETLIDTFGESPLSLRSRAGKSSRLAVYPSRGLAFSYRRESDPVEFLEVFPPTSAAEYEAEIYDDPGPFLK